MNLKAKVERDEKVPIKKVNNRTHFFERVHKTKEVRQQKSTKSIKHQKSSKSNEVKPTKKFKNAKELINLKEVKNTKEVKTHILVFLRWEKCPVSLSISRNVLLNIQIRKGFKSCQGTTEQT